jgi:hypothetical protein
MRFRKSIGIVVSLLLLAAILLLFLDPWGQFRGDAGKVRLPGGQEADRITIRDDTDSVTLVKENGIWLVNGDPGVEQVAVENLLYAAAHLQVVSVLQPSEMPDRGQVRVVQFYRGDRQLLQFEAITGGERFIVRPRGSSRLFSVMLPGYDGLDLEHVFSGNPGHYMKHVLLDLMPAEIARIRVERAGEMPFMFSMNEEGDINCILPGSDSIVPPGMLDDLSVRLLFSYFTAIRFKETDGPAEAVMENGKEQGRWLGTLQVESREGEQYTLRVFSMPGEGDSGSDMFRALVIYNDLPDALVVNYIYLDVLLRGLSRYFAARG